MLASTLNLGLSEWKDLAAIFGAALAFATLLKGLMEYVRQGAQKRAELFLSMQRRLVESTVLDGITEMLETGDARLAETPIKDKSVFLRYFEEIALMVNSGLLRKDVAHYMFGYYAIRCWESDYFWTHLNRQGPYWALFREFAGEMARMEKKPFYVNRFAF